MPGKAKKASTRKKAKAAPKGDSYLVVVESPAKSKTINKILGKAYKVVASMGHIVDLPLSRMGVDFKDNFKPEYSVMKGREKYLKNIKKEAKGVTAVYLAADPDREGEAICWHLKNLLDADKKITKDIHRVSFEEITAKAVQGAFNEPRTIDMNKVNAQQARRVLDRIVGYSLSPLLWEKITRGLSAGRVQSVAVRLVCEREEEIRRFKPQEYWSLDAVLKKNGETDGKDPVFKAKLVKYKGEKISVHEKPRMDEITAQLENERFVVKEVSRKDKKSYPRSPFTTSILQQEAFNKLGFSASKTMSVAQSLYEGVELGEEGSVGLITYMRTDSVRISDDAQSAVRELILSRYGNDYCPEEPPKYKAKKRAQEAHEAIRPTLPLRHPVEVRKYLTEDEYKLYNLIWKKFLSSQMTNAVYSVLTVHIDAGEYRFRAGGARLMFDGFLKVYIEDRDYASEAPEIPELNIGEETELVELVPEQHFTKPPARYTDASLVKMMEEKGIGRPSTYAPIIKTIIGRNYIKRVSKSLQPTELGELVNKLLLDNFPNIVDYEFTANMENELDYIEEGSEEWIKVVREFYSSFEGRLAEAKTRMKNVKKHVVETDEVCEKCGKPMVVKWGRRGRFMSCSGFPACKHSKSITTGVKCPSEGCDGELVERKSVRGVFYGCTNYPKCTFTTRRLPSGETDQDQTPESPEEA
ncbi:MAG: type I DNA topoisomerase [Candidatus Omnitrophica bacterium]|nr:type I DNA topoisomerase [Candidatus Omnitrophota bacterium]MDD5487624.1 type I DNA topoisomerase [Candidatus Omnitrophota bacterium]